MAMSRIHSTIASRFQSTMNHNRSKKMKIQLDSLSLTVGTSSISTSQNIDLLFHKNSFILTTSRHQWTRSYNTKDSPNTLPYSWKDPLMLEEMLTEEERLIRDRVSLFAQSELFPRVVELNRCGKIDIQLLRRMGQVGLFSLEDSPHMRVASGLIARELERVDSAFRSAYSVQTALVLGALRMFASKDQLVLYEKRLMSGEILGCFGLTETEAGSDPSSMTTRLSPCPNSSNWLLNGVKTWITNSPIADLLIIWAKIEDSHDPVGNQSQSLCSSSEQSGYFRKSAIRAVLIDRNIPGLDTPEIEGKCSLRASTTGMIVMKDVVVKESQFLPNTIGLKSALDCLQRARYGISWGVIGAAQFCYEMAREYTCTRHQFGRPLANFQLVQQELAEMQTEITLAQLANIHVGRLYEKHHILPQPCISLLKRNNCAKSLEIARKSRMLLGANGIIDEYHVMRHANNLEAVSTYEGTHQIHTLILGHAITNCNAFGRENIKN